MRFHPCLNEKSEQQMIRIQNQNDKAHLFPNELKSLCRQWRNLYLIEYYSVILTSLFSE